ncbi:MAG: amidohydrolase family protein [Nocardia sp.]|nr:amidohydrolase family protein [Nocardia sp.]
MFDSHVHIIDPRYPLIENQGYLPEPFTIADYRKRMARFDVNGGAVVSASFQGTDTTYMTAALAELGPEWVGVINLPPDVTDQQILDLDRAGVRAVRFNLKRAAVDIVTLTQQALRAHELAGWHAELYIDGSMLGSLEPVLSKLPALVIDHMGMSDECLPYLLRLVERGALVKASGFGRISMDTEAAMRRIHAVNPAALMFGSDLPGNRSDRPFLDSDIAIIGEAVGAAQLNRVLEDNARACYRLPPKDRSEQDPSPTLPIHRGEPRTLRLHRTDLPGAGDTKPFPAVE